MLLELSHISKHFGQVEALSSVGFNLPLGEHLALLGESGSGKSTILRLIAGFETPDSGEIRLNGKILSSEKRMVPPHQRGVGMIFQDNALFPHLNVAENIGFGVEKASRDETVTRLLEMIGMAGMGKRYPHELSGGQQQRVAIARSLATKPELLLLDEPFSSLDPSIRYQVRDESFRLLNQSGIASILVTHDIEDALAFSQRLIVIRHGAIVQDGDARELYEKPANAYVAGLFGPINRMEENAGQLRYFRPEDASLEEGIGGKWSGVVEKSTFHGRKHRLQVSGEGFNFTIDSDRAYSVGTRLQVIPDESAVKTTLP